MFREYAEQYPATESGENKRKYSNYIITLKLFFVNQSVSKMAFLCQKIINDKSIPSSSLLILIFLPEIRYFLVSAQFYDIWLASFCKML